MSQDNLPEKISPEGVHVANVYLESSCNISDTARVLNMQRHEVAEILDNRYVKKYIDNVMQEAGFRQMNKLEEIMNELIEKKMQELAEAEVGSSKDIADLLALANKMANDKAKLLHEKAKEEKVLLQKNTQFNIYDSASSYGKLMEAIASGKDI